MHVKIGPYPTRLICRIHSRYMEKKYGLVDWPEEQTQFENFLEKLEDAIQSVYNLINVPFLDERKQKVKVRIDRWDTWSMDHTLASIVVPMLEQLKETKHGSPEVDDKDVPEHLRSTSAPPKKNDWDIDDNWHKRWDWVLDEMIWAFNEHIKDDGEDQFYSGEHDIVFEKVEGTCYSQMKRGPNDTWKVDKAGLKAYHKRKVNGFRLFGKYYQSLWD